MFEITVVSVCGLHGKNLTGGREPMRKLETRLETMSVYGGSSRNGEGFERD